MSFHIPTLLAENANRPVTDTYITAALDDAVVVAADLAARIRTENERQR